MKKQEPLKMKKQPFMWRQAVSKSEHMGWSLHNLVFYPIINHNFGFKQHQSFLFDYLILGSNPLLNLITLIRITQLNPDTEKRVGIMVTDEFDYWSYHMLDNALFWKEVSRILKITAHSFEELLEQVLKHYSFENIQLYWIDSATLHITESTQVSHPSLHGYITHITNNSRQSRLGYQEDMPTVTDIEQLIKRKYLSVMEKFFSRHAKVLNSHKISFTHPEQSDDYQEKTHILLSHHLYLTTLPNGWLNINHEVKDNITFFHHSFKENAFGNAVKIANNFHALERQSITDIEDILQKIKSS
jgi:hypothetical protein